VDLDRYGSLATAALMKVDPLAWRRLVEEPGGVERVKYHASRRRRSVLVRHTQQGIDRPSNREALREEPDEPPWTDHSDERTLAGHSVSVDGANVERRGASSFTLALAAVLVPNFAPHHLGAKCDLGHSSPSYAVSSLGWETRTRSYYALQRA
jgi:hypothetical protein